MVENVPARVAAAALRSNLAARLIDVRTQPEWLGVGVPRTGVEGNETRFVSWQTAPAMQHNTGFLQELAAAGVGKEDALYFICRSGARSLAAAEAASQAGYGEVYNVMEGFEGGRNGPGWQAQGLPAGTWAG